MCEMVIATTPRSCRTFACIVLSVLLELTLSMEEYCNYVQDNTGKILNTVFGVYVCV